MKTGIAGALAGQFINSKLTPLLMIAFMAIGIYSASLTPREEEPQIDVPIADIFILRWLNSYFNSKMALH